ncbi:hypothetical protein HHK36_013717 [Tetracentron sinense]|uniref:Uncharacterized protein n=1 Tax=Tetracentron sinense TaxID=13715 RepID=A0A834Z2K6_TETSI|nr:hypothetical protein HHK36_013717 [Tetracentron sinense]
MVPHPQSLTTTYLSPSIFPHSRFSKNISISSAQPIKGTHLNHSKKTPSLKFSFQPLKCSVSVVSEPIQMESRSKPFPAEVSRTIMELSSRGTLSTLTQEGWPLGTGVRFAVDREGMPILCFNDANRKFSIDRRSSLHVQVTPFNCSVLFCLQFVENLKCSKTACFSQELHSIWKERFGEEVDEDLIYVVAVERVLQIEDFKEDGVWVNSSEYKNANPDPLRDYAEKIVNEINTNYMEDVHRFCNIYVDLDFQVHTQHRFTF